MNRGVSDDRYFDHEADIGIIGRGKTLAGCFEDAAYSMFALMADLSAVRPTQTRQLEFTESDPELALVTWLNRLLASSNAENLVFSQFTLQRSGALWQGSAAGETWREEMERGIDVKGATLTLLSVKEAAGGWEARCVVDV